jgi:lipopolysaccharide/colanic/teichoic acid biosynthesis glycosyltransferase
MYIFLFKSTRFNKNIIYIGTDESLKLLLKITDSSEVNFNILGRLGSEDGLHNSMGVPKIDLKEHSLSDFINKRGVEEIIICKDSYSNTMDNQFNKELAHLFEQGVNIQSMAEFYMEMTNCIPKRYLDSSFYEHLTFSSSHSNRFYIYFMRILDMIGSLIGLILFALILPFILIGNVFGNRGRVFYTQTRTGKHEKPFKILKLRTMIANAEEQGAQYASVGDTRITPFGRFLRNSRLDEVPQLINVLKGDMKLIGPRPERPEFIEELAKEIPFYKLRHIVPPGLTGWAQVMYPYANSVEEQERKLRYDLYYLKNRNFYMDFQIAMKTIGTVLFFRGQ